MIQTSSGYKQTEAGVIPDDWALCPLADITLCLDSVRVPLNEEQRSAMQGAYPYCGANGVLDYVNDYVIDDDIILIAEDGGYFDEYASRPIAYRMSGKCWVNNHAHVLKALAGVEQGFLFFSLVHKNILRYIASGTRAKLNRSELDKIEVALPPLPEQRAIAAALGDVDALIASLDRLIAKKRDLKQAAMQQLLTGKTRLLGFTGDWQRTTLGAVADCIKGTGLSKTDTQSHGPRKCILYGELFTTYRSVITAVVSRTESRQGTLSSWGDVLLPASTTTVGVDLATASALLDDNVAIGGDINIIRQQGDSSYHPIFLAYYLPIIKRRDIGNLAQGITIVHLYGKHLLGLSIELPSLPEQRAIAAVLADIDAEIDALQRRRDKTRALKQGMMQQLLTGRIRLV